MRGAVRRSVLLTLISPSLRFTACSALPLPGWRARARSRRRARRRLRVGFRKLQMSKPGDPDWMRATSPIPEPGGLACGRGAERRTRRRLRLRLAGGFELGGGFGAHRASSFASLARVRRGAQAFRSAKQRAAEHGCAPVLEWRRLGWRWRARDLRRLLRLRGAHRDSGALGPAKGSRPSS